MRLATIRVNQDEKACICTSIGPVPIDVINKQWRAQWPVDMWTLLQTGSLEALCQWYRSGGKAELESRPDRQYHIGEEARFVPPYRFPRKIWGIGLNYEAHARDLSEKAPQTEPASFMKPDTAVIGHGDCVLLPRQSKRTTAEAELGVIIGKRCKDVSKDDWLSVVAAYVPVLDMTAEDILRRNPRYLTRAKSFDTFFSFGPAIVTTDEVQNVTDLNVATVINGEIRAKNTVSNMTFPPDYLVSFHSRVMTLLPGDIISTGTPGASVIRHGDTIECRIDGFEPLVNQVSDLKESCC